MKQAIRMGALLLAAAVLLGAFGAHALKAMVDPAKVAIFETGVRYQFYHALGVLVCGLVAERANPTRLRWAVRLFLVGILLFSGSLYLLTFTEQLLLPWGIIGPLTPIGGVCFVAAWGVLAFAVTDD
ncbi:MAG: DUF423 domain-containing protein [Bacteroidota bacterium]